MLVVLGDEPDGEGGATSKTKLLRRTTTRRAETGGESMGEAWRSQSKVEVGGLEGTKEDGDRKKKGEGGEGSEEGKGERRHMGGENSWVSDEKGKEEGEESRGGYGGAE